MGEQQLSTSPVIKSQGFDHIEDHGADPLLLAVEWLCKYHNKTTSKEVLYAGLPRGKKLEPEVALRMLDQVGIAAGWIKRDLSKVSHYLFPLVIVCRDGAYCIITSRLGTKGNYQYQVMTPESGGTLTMSEVEVMGIYSGYAMVANPKPQLDRRTDDEILPQATMKDIGCSVRCGAIVITFTAQLLQPYWLIY